MLDCVARVAKVSNSKVSSHENLKILSSKQIIQILQIALAKAGNTSDKLLHEIKQIIYVLY